MTDQELVAPDVDERLKRIIWRGLGSKTVREIAEDAGVAPDVVLRVKREMLDGIDILTINEQRAKMMADMAEVADLALDRARGVGTDSESMRNLGPVLTAAVQAQKTILVQLAQMEKATAGEVDKLNAMRINELVRMMQRTVDASVAELDDGKPHSAEEMFAVFNRNLIEAAAVVEADHG